MNEKGLTLIEVLVAMIILAVGLLGLAPLVVMSIEANSMSQDAMSANNLAKEKIETLQNTDLIPALPFKEEEAGLTGGYNRYTAIWDDATDTLLPPDLCQLEVVIAWNDKMGVPRTATYSAYIEK